MDQILPLLGLGSVAPGHLLTVVILLYFPLPEGSYRSSKICTLGRDNGPMAGEERKYRFIRDPSSKVFLTKIVCYMHALSHAMESATPRYLVTVTGQCPNLPWAMP